MTRSELEHAIRAACDVSGDDVQHLAVADNGATRLQWCSASETKLLAPQLFAVGIAPRAVTVGDFNKDGAEDPAVASDGSNSVSVLLHNGDRTFQSTRDIAAGGGPHSVAVSDFNADEQPDLAVANLDHLTAARSDGREV